MSRCENCELFNRPCPGLNKGAFCTEITQKEHMANHPSAKDPTGAGMSCEIREFYEKPSIKRARKNES